MSRSRFQPFPRSWQQLYVSICPSVLISEGAAGFKMGCFDWQPVIGICLRLSIASYDVIREDPQALAYTARFISYKHLTQVQLPNIY